MKIEIWLDYACEKSYVTHLNLMQTLNQLNYDVEVLYRSYISLSTEEIIDPQVKHMIMSENPNYIQKEHFNTIYAHSLSHLAKKHQLANKANDLIFKSIYLDNMDLSEIDNVIKLGVQIGLDEQSVKNVLEKQTYLEAIEQNYINAVAKKINKIPHIRINGKVNLSGYQDKAILKLAIHHEYHKANHMEHCIDGACEKHQ